MTKPLPVIITPNAADDLTATWVWLRERNPKAADEWLDGIRQTILALGDLPHAYPVADEAQSLDTEVRRALFGNATKWRIYYAILNDKIQVLHVRHGRQSAWQG